MPVGDPNGNPFKIPLTPTGGSGGSTGGTTGEATLSGTVASGAPTGDGGSTPQLLITKEAFGGDDPVVFQSYASGSTSAPASFTDVVDRDGFGSTNSIFKIYSTDTLFDTESWESHLASTSFDWII